MSSTEATERIDNEPSGRPAYREWAPSQTRPDQPGLIWWSGLGGLLLVVLGGTIIVLWAAGRHSPIPFFGFGSACLMVEVGVVLMLFHAASDPDLQIRRTYGVLGLAWLGAGAVLCLVWYRGVVGGLFGFGFLGLAGGLLFLLASLRYEHEAKWRNAITGVIGGAGALIAVIAFLGSNIGAGDFLLPRGLLLALLALGYLWAFVSLRGSSDDLGHRVGLAVGGLGLVVLLVALGRSLLPPLFYSWHWISGMPAPYFKPVGFLLICLGALYLAVSAALCSENTFVVMTRRELAAFFYSPIAYIVLVGLTLVAGFYFADFVDKLTRSAGPGQAAIPEPIVRAYMFALAPFICMIFIVPVLTMRLLSEEQRTGTLEVLLTAPVNETRVVLSKFFASLVFLLLAWAPWGLLLGALRLEGGQPFDYRPIISFFIALTFIGAAFMSMGLFFSSLTRNQVASAILTFAGMLLFLGITLIRWQLEGQAMSNQAWVTVLTHMSYGDLWLDSLNGSLTPRYLIFFASLAVLWLFGTVKVLEIRRWS
jgi:ABC-type transport system involved in multi-copper enzyme maturation permease subunit